MKRPYGSSFIDQQTSSGVPSANAARAAAGHGIGAGFGLTSVISQSGGVSQSGGETAGRCAMAATYPLERAVIGTDYRIL
jgi:hypothetical protein